MDDDDDVAEMDSHVAAVRTPCFAGIFQEIQKNNGTKRSKANKNVIDLRGRLFAREHGGAKKKVSALLDEDPAERPSSISPEPALPLAAAASRELF